MRDSTIQKISDDLYLETYTRGNFKYQVYKNDKNANPENIYHQHREDGPALIVTDLNGELVEEAWRINGKLHRKDGPAHILKNLKNKTIQETWYVNDVVHRDDDKPAIITRDFSGKIIEKIWYHQGIIKRTGSKDLPALMSHDRQYYTFKWFAKTGDRIHRAENPASVIFDSQRNVVIEAWIFDEKEHRLDGPCTYEYDLNTLELSPAKLYKSFLKTWCINGKSYDNQTVEVFVDAALKFLRENVHQYSQDYLTKTIEFLQNLGQKPNSSSATMESVTPTKYDRPLPPIKELIQMLEKEE